MSKVLILLVLATIIPLNSSAYAVDEEGFKIDYVATEDALAEQMQLLSADCYHNSGGGPNCIVCYVKDPSFILRCDFNCYFPQGIDQGTYCWYAGKDRIIHPLMSLSVPATE